jgi:hypothetical protein
MASPDFARYAALAVGGFQVLANGVLLARGLSRLPAELLKESATPRLANLLRTSWVYGMLANLCLSGLLLLIASALGKSDPLARRAALAIAVYYVVVGVATFSFAPGRQHGLLVFSLLGLILGGAVLLSSPTP